MLLEHNKARITQTPFTNCHRSLVISSSDTMTFQVIFKYLHTHIYTHNDVLLFEFTTNYTTTDRSRKDFGWEYFYFSLPKHDFHLKSKTDQFFGTAQISFSCFQTPGTTEIVQMQNVDTSAVFGTSHKIGAKDVVDYDSPHPCQWAMVAGDDGESYTTIYGDPKLGRLH